MRKIIVLGAVLGMSLAWKGADPPRFRVVVDEAYNALFVRSEGWTGGDVACTVPLAPNLTLWLFGDSWIGPVVGGRHAGADMIHNAAALQRGSTPDPRHLRFYYGRESAKPAALFRPPGGRGFLWPTRGGIRTDAGLFLVASRVVKKDGDDSVFGFEGIGNVLLFIRNPLDDPDRWDVTATPLPFSAKTGAGTEIDFGDPQLVKDGIVYIYGAALTPRENRRDMLLARVPVGRFSDFAAWEFYANGIWQGDFRKATPLCDRFGAEYSVSFVPKIRKYVTVYSELGMSEKICLRTADEPWGPWSAQEIVYRAPEAAWDASYFCYAARGHAELSADDELLVSYVCNSTDFWKMAADARIYRPKFIRIRFP